MKKKYLACMLIFSAILAFGTALFALLSNSSMNHRPLHFTYDLVRAYPHDRNAFTQGLVYEDGVLYESTGLYGYSTLRRVELETGTTTQVYALPNQFFGEGITIFDDKIIQLTWRSNRGFVYDKHSFELLQEFTYPTEGWGITYDGSRLILSDGTATLYFLDPETLERVDQVEVCWPCSVSQITVSLIKCR